MEENEKQEGGISLGEIFRIMFTQKWLFIAILVVVTLAGTIGIYFGKNVIEEEYVVTFNLELPQTEIKDEATTKSSATVVYYPDGTPFYYTDIVSLATLRKVKNSSEAFEDINVEKMAKDGDISISRSINETATNSGAYESIYSLSVKASYFPNKDVAREFVVALTNTPIDYLRLMDIDYNVNINSARVAPNYVTELSQLISQTEYIIGRYDTFVAIYNDLSIDGRTMRSYCQDVKFYLYDSAELDILRTEVRQNPKEVGYGGYLKSADLKDRYQVELTKLEKQKEIADFTLTNLTNKGDSESISAEVFKAQSDLVIELTQEIKEIEEVFLKSDDYDGVDAQGVVHKKSEAHLKFLDSLEKAYEQVQAYTDEFKDVVSKLYSKVAVVSYSNSNVIVTENVTSLVVSFIISFLVGLILAMIVAFIVGWYKNKKALSAAQSAAQAAAVQTQPTEASAVAQANEMNSEQENR